MADTTPPVISGSEAGRPERPGAAPLGIEEARSLARDRFKSRLLAGEAVGGCGCHETEIGPAASAEGPDVGASAVVGVRFRDSGRTYFFDPAGASLAVGDWVVVETGRGDEAGRVVIAPSQVRTSQLEGDVKPIRRRLSDDDVRRMDGNKREAAAAVRTFGVRLRSRRLALKPIAAEFSFDRASLLLSYSVPDRERAPDQAILGSLAGDLEAELGCRVELRQVGPRDEARLLGGLGRCGRTLCCSSWLPVFPEISSNMAKTQDLPLNPSKVSGVCGRLLCCLSYENEQYKQMKAVLPRLGQTIETPVGPGMVVSLQVLKELVTVRLHGDQSVAVFASAELGLGTRGPEPVPVAPAAPAAAELATDEARVPLVDDADDDRSGQRKRRRRGRRGGAGGGVGAG